MLVSMIKYDEMMICCFRPVLPGKSGGSGFGTRKFRVCVDRTDQFISSCYCVRFLSYASVLYVHTIVLLFTDAEIKGELFIFPKYVQKEAFEAKLVEFHSMHIMRWSSY